MGGKLSTGDIIIGTVLLIIGLILLLDQWTIPGLALVAAIALVVVGILMLMGKMNGGQVGGVIAVVVGVAMLISGQLAGSIASILNLVIGIVAVVAGVLKFLGRW